MPSRVMIAKTNPATVRSIPSVQRAQTNPNLSAKAPRNVEPNKAPTPPYVPNRPMVTPSSPDGAMSAKKAAVGGPTSPSPIPIKIPEKINRI